jgi:hypothetical protein
MPGLTEEGADTAINGRCLLPRGHAGPCAATTKLPPVSKLPPIVRLEIRDLLNAQGVDDVNAIAAIFQATGVEEICFALDVPTQAMVIAVRELHATRPGETRPEHVLTTVRHALQLGLALLCKCWDEPEDYNAAHDGCLDLIDTLRSHCGIPLTGEAGGDVP